MYLVLLPHRHGLGAELVDETLEDVHQRERQVDVRRRDQLREAGSSARVNGVFRVRLWGSGGVFRGCLGCV